MSQIFLEEVANIEGFLSIQAESKEKDAYHYLKSGRTHHFEGRLFGKYPLEAVTQVQSLSAMSGVSHALAATMALEDYLQIEPTHGAIQIRKVLHQLSTLHAHLTHFYLEVVPDYLNEKHLSGLTSEVRVLLPRLTNRKKVEGDLGTKDGKRLLQQLPKVADVQGQIEKAMVLFTGRFPVIPNLIPGGVMNFQIRREQIMEALRILEMIKPFIEEEWAEDVKMIITQDTSLVIPQPFEHGLLSVGSLDLNLGISQAGDYSSGVYEEQKLEPFAMEQVEESLEKTFYKKSAASDRVPLSYDITKEGARTWIKSARYNKQPMMTGALPRMLVTHYGGGNFEVSDSLLAWTSNLGLELETANCGAARMLAEVFEGRFFLQSTFRILLGLDDQAPLSLKTDFDFSGRGQGFGMVEAPAGALMHKVMIEKNKIVNYQIISPQNWNLSTMDQAGSAGPVEKELNRIASKKELTVPKAQRILHSYYTQALDATQ